MLIGRSGLQYHTTILCSKPLDIVVSVVRDFYQNRKAVIQDGSGGETLCFSRGRVWISKLSWMLPLSETWPRQTISISFRQESEIVHIDIRYDVRVCYTMIAAPNALTKEARDLRLKLEVI
jgi:hypothetical protein